MGGKIGVGSVIDNKYRIEKALLDRGWYWLVLGRQLSSGQQVSLKLWKSATIGVKEAEGRFEQERRLTAQLTSPQVMHVIDEGRLENGAHYTVSEGLPGRPLSAIIEEQGPLPPSQAVDWVLQLCEALAEAHLRGIVHRSLGRACFWLCPAEDGSRRIKILDFNLLKDLSLEAASLTAETANLGVPVYMSPEQLRSSKNVDARTDIWALGVTLYEMVAGKVPFLQETMVDLCMSITFDAPAPLAHDGSDRLLGLETVCFKALEKERENRYQTVGELARALSHHGTEQARLSCERIRQLERQLSA
jgi:serine/threonine-protein kinase